MGYQTLRAPREAWQLAADQHGVIARRQLLDLGFHPQAIKHRIARGRLHPVRRGVYAVGRPELTRHGSWMAAVLACGARAALSHESAGALWGITADRPGPIHVSVPSDAAVRPRAGIAVHRRVRLVDDVTERDRIPITSIVWTLVDLAARLPRARLEAAVNEADKLDLIDAETLRRALERRAGTTGVAQLRSLLDRRIFVLTDSELERRFLPLARQAGLPLPRTAACVNGFKVDFHWPQLGLIVETDGLRYHRTPAQQTRDRRRDQVHAASGLTTLRFTHSQVKDTPEQVISTLVSVARRLRVTG